MSQPTVIINLTEKAKGNQILDGDIITINDSEYIKNVFQLEKVVENIYISYIIGVKIGCYNNIHEVYYINSKNEYGKTFLGSGEILRILNENKNQLLQDIHLVDHLRQCNH